MADELPQFIVETGKPAFRNYVGRINSVAHTWTFGHYVSALGVTVINAGTGMVANQAYYIPLRVPFPVSISQAYVWNGATITSNFDIGVYTTAGTKLASIGSTAQSGASAVQKVAFSLVLAASEYLLAFAADTNTGLYGNVLLAATSGTYPIGFRQEASAFPLPATATPVFGSTVRLPFFGLIPAGVW